LKGAEGETRSKLEWQSRKKIERKQHGTETGDPMDNKGQFPGCQRRTGQGERVEFDRTQVMCTNGRDEEIAQGSKNLCRERGRGEREISGRGFKKPTAAAGTPA